MYHVFFLHSWVSGPLGCFHVLAIVNSDAMNIEVHASFQIRVFVFSAYVLRNEITGSHGSSPPWLSLFPGIFFLFYFTILYWFCHTSTRICHGYTRVPHPEPPSLLRPPTIPLGCLSAPAPSVQYHASNLDWRFVSYTILYMFQCHSPKSSHPLPFSLPLPQSLKDCFVHLCLFCCLAYRVIVAFFLNSIYMR